MLLLEPFLSACKSSIDSIFLTYCFDLIVYCWYLSMDTQQFFFTVILFYLFFELCIIQSKNKKRPLTSLLSYNFMCGKECITTIFKIEIV